MQDKETPEKEDDKDKKHLRKSLWSRSKESILQVKDSTV